MWIGIKKGMVKIMAWALLAAALLFVKLSGQA
jgi:hypothetical protein